MDNALLGAHAFAVPRKIVYGEGALAEATPIMGSMGGKALIVTDKMMVRLGNLARVTGVLDAAEVSYHVFDGVNSEPLDTMVEEGVRCFLEQGCDFMVALGGGSPIDTMKAIALCAASGRAISSFMGKPYEGAVCPMVAIPTTAGTGSEATQFTIITDTDRDVKMLIAGTPLIPELAVIDPVFTVTAPASVTAATGVDALCHAIEAYTSRKAQPLSETFALSAAKRIFQNLAACVREPENVAVRTQMSIAAMEAGIAFNNASVTLIHGMSRPIGALFHVPHGLSNAMLMEECLAFALDGAQGRFAEVARFCELSDSVDDAKAARDLMAAIRSLLAEMEIPTLAEFGVEREAFFAAIDKMARDAEASGSPANTVKPVTQADMRAIYERVYR